MSFAALEARVNAAVMRRLWNASALIVGGSVEFPVIFESVAAIGEFGITGPSPQATAADADVVALTPHSSQIVINGATYLVLDKQSDGTGLTSLVLEAA